MSYSSTTNVKTFTRHLLDGQSAFNSTTRPTGTEVTAFLNRAEAILNVALANEGLTTPITNTTAVLACAEWSTEQTVRFVELTQRGSGYSDAEGSRERSFPKPRTAREFARENRLGFIRLGVGVSQGKAQGLQYTGLDEQSTRDDRTDTALEQPAFERHAFDRWGPRTPNTGANEDDDV